MPPPPSSKLSPNSMHPPLPPSHLGHSPNSYRSSGQHPLIPMSMLAKGRSSPNNNNNGGNNNSNPIVSSSNSASSNSSSSVSSNSQLLSPILFSPLSASSAASEVAHYKRKLGQLTSGAGGPSEASEVPSANSTSVGSDSGKWTYSNTKFRTL